MAKLGISLFRNRIINFYFLNLNSWLLTLRFWKRGSREAGKQGSREAGKQGSREAGKRGSREAGSVELGDGKY